MQNPRLIFVHPNETAIHIKNILMWASDNPRMRENFQGVEFDALLQAVGEAVDELVAYWEDNGENIMAAISKISGIAWDSNETPAVFVYPIPFFHSFSHPLFLKVCSVEQGKVKKRSLGLNLGMLIHELFHINTFKLSLPRDRRELFINFATTRILASFSREYLKAYTDFHRAIGKPFDFTSVPEALQSGTRTIKEAC